MLRSTALATRAIAYTATARLASVHTNAVAMADHSSSTGSDNAAADLHVRKSSMRARVGATMAALPAPHLDAASTTLLQRVIAHPTYVQASSLCLFVSMPSGEVQTDALLQHALEAGKRVFVPRIEPPPKKGEVATTATSTADAPIAPSTSSSSVSVGAPLPPAHRRMQLLELASAADLASFRANRWGIREPPLTHATGSLRASALHCDDLTLVVCPGVAFDQQCRRLGHGKGYYDTFIALLRQVRIERGVVAHVHTIGIGLDEQVVDEVPVGHTDLPLDEILTHTQHFRAPAAGATP